MSYENQIIRYSTWERERQNDQQVQQVIESSISFNLSRSADIKKAQCRHQKVQVEQALVVWASCYGQDVARGKKETMFVPL